MFRTGKPGLDLSKKENWVDEIGMNKGTIGVIASKDKISVSDVFFFSNQEEVIDWTLRTRVYLSFEYWEYKRDSVDAKPHPL